MRIAILGLGHIGSFLFAKLSQPDERGDYTFSSTIESVKGYDFTNGYDLADEQTLRKIIEGADIVIAATPYTLNHQILTLCAALDKHYFDLTEDVSIIELAKSLHTKAILVPQCGLAPGIVSILAQHLCDQFITVKDVFMRVGALPTIPTNRMGYNLTWNTLGLINEYTKPCTVLENGERRIVAPLDGHEELIVGEKRYEAAYTSGGIGSFIDSLIERKAAGDQRYQYIRHANYKTLRHQGHFELMRFLRDDLDMGGVFRDTFVDIFNSAVPRTSNDRVILMVKVVGENGGSLEDRAEILTGIAWRGATAIQSTTGYGLLAVLKYMLDYQLFDDRNRGYHRQEDIGNPKRIVDMYRKFLNGTA